MYHSVRSFVFT